MKKQFILAALLGLSLVGTASADTPANTSSGMYSKMLLRLKRSKVPCARKAASASPSKVCRRWMLARMRS